MIRWPKVIILNIIFLFSLNFFVVKDKRKQLNGLIAGIMAVAGVILIVFGVILLLLSVDNQSIATPSQMVENGIVFFIFGLLLQLALGTKIR